MRTILIILLMSFTVANANIIAGNAQGSVTLVEFYDYQCPHCMAMSGVIDNVLQASPNLRVVYRPIAVMNELSRFEALSAIAANEQGKFEALHGALMTHRITNVEQIFLLAEKVGINVPALQEAMQSKEAQETLANNLQLFYSTKASGIPLILIGNQNNIIAVHNGETTYEELIHETV
jgi:protein-disulfide isomerase